MVNLMLNILHIDLNVKERRINGNMALSSIEARLLSDIKIPKCAFAVYELECLENTNHVSVYVFRKMRDPTAKTIRANHFHVLR